MYTAVWIMLVISAVKTASGFVIESLPSSQEVIKKYNFTGEQIEMNRKNGMLVYFKKSVKELDQEKRGKQAALFLCAHFLIRASNQYIFEQVCNQDSIKDNLGETYVVKDDDPVCHPLLGSRDRGNYERFRRQVWLTSIHKSEHKLAKTLRTKIVNMFKTHSDPVIQANSYKLCSCTFAKYDRMSDEDVYIKYGLNATMDPLTKADAISDEILLTQDEFMCLKALLSVVAYVELHWIPFSGHDKYFIPQVSLENCYLPRHLKLVLRSGS